MKSYEKPIIQFDQENINFMESVSRIHKDWMIDGTMFDGGDMVLSCRGVADNEYNVMFHRPPKEEQRFFTPLNTWKLEEETRLPPKSPLHRLRIWVDTQVITKIKQDPDYRTISFVIFRKDVEHPLIMAQLE